MVGAAALGLLSHGPLSRTTMEAGTLALRFERLERIATSNHFEIRVGGLRSGEEVMLRLSAEFLHKYDFEEVTPRPLRTSAGSAGFEGVFTAAASGDLHLYIRTRARRFGLLRFALDVPGRGSLSVRQFIFP